MQSGSFRPQRESNTLRPIAGVEISCPKVGPHRVDFLLLRRCRPAHLVQLVVVFTSSLWVFYKHEGRVSPALELILAHALQMRSLDRETMNPLVWEAAHNVRLTRAIGRSPQAGLGEERIRAFLLERESVLQVIPHFEMTLDPEQVGQAALHLYEAVAYKLDYAHLLALVEALAGLADGIEAGELNLANHQRSAVGIANAALANHI